jgi:molybdopterin synthase catalytic subunit
VSIRITRTALSVSKAYAELEDPESGGAVLFLGRVRPDRSDGARIRALDYETHRELAERAFRELDSAARRRFGARRIVLWHRFGVVPVGAPSVIVGVAAPHRSSAFDAARFLIDELKQTAPIWKHDVTRAPRPRRARRNR